MPTATPLRPVVLTRVSGGSGPMMGKTVLVVEDSRAASDALRLMLLQLGARMRRAATLADASRHLSLYRPDAVLVDLGLPDGSGDALIAAMALDPRRPGRIVALSAYPDRAAGALACGADVFLEKPVGGLRALLAALDPGLDLIGADGPPAPDPLALFDDLGLAAAQLRRAPDASARRYLTGFLTGLARQIGDDALAATVASLPPEGDTGLLLRLIEDRRSALPPL